VTSKQRKRSGNIRPEQLAPGAVLATDHGFRGRWDRLGYFYPVDQAGFAAHVAAGCDCTTG